MKFSSSLAPRDDTGYMAQLLDAPTPGLRGCHRCGPKSPREQLELKHGLLNSFKTAILGHVKEESHATSIFQQAHFYVESRMSRDSLNSAAVLKDMVKALLLDKKTQSPAPTPVKAVEESCVTYGGAHSYQTCPTTTDNVYQDNIQGITTRSGIAYKGPTIPITSSPKVMEREPEVTKDTMLPTNNGSTEDVQPLVVPVVHSESISEPVNAPVSASMPNQKASIPFPSRRNDERRREKANDQIENSTKAFRDLSFNI
ncbi:hypothetical protein Tco_0218226 [Tanacetum coccineum]